MLPRYRLAGLAPILILCFLVSCTPAAQRPPLPAPTQPAPTQSAPASSPAGENITCPVGTTDQDLESGGIIRQFRLHVPPSYSPDRPLPLVINFHGYSSMSAEYEMATNFSFVADQKEFIIVYPQALGAPSAWEIGSGQSVDVDFTLDLIQRIESLCKIDPSRVYAAGFSMGGGMANLLACVLSDRFAAIATVSGTYPDFESCSPKNSVPVISFHGTSDSVVPYTGMASDPVWPKIPDWAAGWGKRNACSFGPAEIYRHDPVSAQAWGGCRDGADVVLYTVENGAHTWPAFAAETIWDFFSQHPYTADQSEEIHFTRYPGNSTCFKIETSSGKTIVTDPYAMTEDVEADIVTESHQHSDHNDASRLTGNYFLFTTSGDFLARGIRITGISGKHNRPDIGETNIIYVFDIGGLRIAEFASQGAMPTEDMFAQIGRIDVLIIQPFPQAGDKLSFADVRAIAARTQARVIIPAHGDENAAPALAAMMGGESLTYNGTLTIKRSDLEQMRTVQLYDLRP